VNGAPRVQAAFIFGCHSAVTMEKVSALQALGSPAAIVPADGAAIAVVLAVLAARELLFRYLVVTARRVRSSLLEASAWHARADAALVDPWQGLDDGLVPSNDPAACSDDSRSTGSMPMIASTVGP
jgi:hypothetical protein